MSISNFEYKKMSVTCLGPVHITDEVGTVYSYQYLYDAGSRRVYFLNERLWVKFLYKHNLLAEFEELIKTRLRAGTLCEWVQEKGFKIEDLGDAVTDYAGVEVAPEILAANKMRLTEIVRTVHNVEGQPYIPGSSIKGALRTGLLFGLLVRPARGREPWVVLPGRGPGEDLEAGLRQLAWLRRAGLFRGEAVIWDEALDREGRQLALRLALRWPWVICCPPGELEEWLREAVRQTDGVPQ